MVALDFCPSSKKIAYQNNFRKNASHGLRCMRTCFILTCVCDLLAQAGNFTCRTRRPIVDTAARNRHV